MRSATSQVFTLQIQGSKRNQIFLPQVGEVIEQLFERLALAGLRLRKAVEGTEWASFAALEHDTHSGHPVCTLREDQMAYDIERTPGPFPFVATHPDIG